MKHGKFIATLAAGAALAGHAPPPPQLTLTFNTAMEIAQHEIVRRGLAPTHRISALYAGVDRQAEGAAFAVIVCPHAPGNPMAKGATATPRLKLLIHHDGQTTLQPIPGRTPVHA